jgi:glycosyltransferase involved in cell wall biosynthesis
MVNTNDSYSIFGGSFRQFTVLNSFAQGIQAKHKYLYPIPPRLASNLFSEINFPIDSLIGKTDIFHSWDWYLPKSNKTTIVTTVHDLALFKYPDTAHQDIKAHHEQVMIRIKTNNTHVIAVSQSTKNDLINLFGVDPEHITVIYEALPEESKINPSDEEIGITKSKYHINKPYLLMVGTLEPRKNYPRQIEAWRKFKSEYDLVIVGKPGWESLPPENGLVQIGYANGNELASLYKGAQSLLYCSLAEGFGLPILEAFYHQIPVVTSNCSSLSEIADGATIIVDPQDVESITKGIQQSIDTKNDLVQKGTVRLKDFSWEKAAQETLSFYKKALE